MAFFQRFLKFFSAPDSPAPSDIRYGHPSHAGGGVRRENFKSNTPSTPSVPSRPVMPPSARVQDLVLACLAQAGSAGARYDAIDTYVLRTLSLPASAKAMVKEERNALKVQGRIGFNAFTRVWYLKKKVLRDLTPKEERFLSAHGLGAGWRRISGKMDAVVWIHAHFTPDQFENFCIAILNAHCGKPIRITEKRAISGADGGFDGVGQWVIDGKTETVTLQAKRIHPQHQLGDDQCDRFAGALVRHAWRHGLYITTGMFSARFREAVEKFAAQNILIELIDGERLADIMLMRRDDPHGFGLHRTDIGLYYINTDILTAAAG